MCKKKRRRNSTPVRVITRCLLPLLRQSADASVLFTTSGVGNRGRAFWGAYAVSKFGTEGLAQVLADERVFPDAPDRRGHGGDLVSR